MKKQQNKKLVNQTESGFTIVEISLAMAFIAVILIFVAIVTSQILAMYQKGVVVKAVNSVGRGLVENLEGSINSAPAFNYSNYCAIMQRGNPKPTDAAVQACSKDKAWHAFVYNSRVDDQKRQLYGVFCTGSYSYVWNTPYGVDANATLKVKFYQLDAANNGKYIEFPSGNEKLKLARFRDPTRRVCSAATNLVNYDYEWFVGNRTLDLTHYADSNSGDESQDVGLYFNESDVDLNVLSGTDVNLWPYEFTIFPISTNNITGRSFVAGSFILATEGGGINVMESGDYCRNVDENDEVYTSSLFDLGAGFNYCAINKFNFAARTAGE